MTKAEAHRLLKALDGMFPQIKLSPESAAGWIACLEDIDFGTAWANVIAHAKRSPFAPTIAEVRGTVYAKRRPAEEICSVTGSKYQLYS
jgi:hypothetical protein